MKPVLSDQLEVNRDAFVLMFDESLSTVRDHIQSRDFGSQISYKIGLKFCSEWL